MGQSAIGYATGCGDEEALAELRKDDTVIAILQALDLFIAQATRVELGGAARILHQAKEDLVYFSVNQGLHESLEERFVNRHLYKNDLFAVADCISLLASLPQKARQALLEMEVTETPCAELVKMLRQNKK